MIGASKIVACPLRPTWVVRYGVVAVAPSVVQLCCQGSEPGTAVGYELISSKLWSLPQFGFVLRY